MAPAGVLLSDKTAENRLERLSKNNLQRVGQCNEWTTLGQTKGGIQFFVNPTLNTKTPWSSHSARLR